jgi:hypothetical protein
LLFWRKDFAVTSMNDLCDVLSVRSPDLYAAFGSKSGAPSRSRAQLQTIGPPIWGNFEGVTLAPALKTAYSAKRSFSLLWRSLSKRVCSGILGQILAL